MLIRLRPGSRRANPGLLGCWVHWGAPLGASDSSGGRCVHCGVQWGSSGLPCVAEFIGVRVAGFIGMRPGGRLFHSRSLGLLGWAIGVVGFMRGC